MTYTKIATSIKTFLENINPFMVYGVSAKGSVKKS